MMWPFNARREPVHLDMQYPRAERSWAKVQADEELFMIDTMLYGHAAEPERDRAAIDRLLDERLAVTKALTVSPGRSS